MSEPRTIYHERLEYFGKNTKNATGKSDKFYEITVVNDAGVFKEYRSWGKYGSRGQTKILCHYSEFLALESATDQAFKKRAKGYRRRVAALTRLASAMDD